MASAFKAFVVLKKEGKNKKNKFLFKNLFIYKYHYTKLISLLFKMFIDNT